MPGVLLRGFRRYGTIEVDPLLSLGKQLGFVLVSCLLLFLIILRTDYKNRMEITVAVFWLTL
jgi:hypothetical protein